MYSAAQRELWRVGDAQYLLDGQGRNPETAVDAVVLKARQLVTQARLLAGDTVATLRRDDPGREAVKTAARAANALYEPGRQFLRLRGHRQA